MSRRRNPSGKPPIPRELQELWIHLARERWSSLAVVPTEPGSAERTITSALADIAPFYELGSFQLFDVMGASVAESTRLAQDIVAATARGERVVVAVDPPTQNPSAHPVLHVVSAALLVVRLGTSHLETVRSLVEIVGRDRILGAVTVHGKPHRHAQPSGEPARVARIDVPAA